MQVKSYRQLLRRYTPAPATRFLKETSLDLLAVDKREQENYSGLSSYYL